LVLPWNAFKNKLCAGDLTVKPILKLHMVEVETLKIATRVTIQPLKLKTKKTKNSEIVH